MNNLVILKIDGKLDDAAGLRVTLQVGEMGSQLSCSAEPASLPPASLLELYDEWQKAYRDLPKRFLRLEKPEQQTTQKSALSDCRDAAEALRKNLNDWLKSSDSFAKLREQLLAKLDPSAAILVLIQTEDRALRQLPWHLWDFFQTYSQAEIALSPSSHDELPKAVTSSRPLRILAILGNSKDIDVEADRRFLANLPGAETVFLAEPNRQEINDRLWEQNWDILFFAGHSSSQEQGGWIHINPRTRLAIEDLKPGLKKAIARGLRVAIFNSCDGLGLARELEALNLPQIIVMREPVPDRFAQQFLKYFLAAFAGTNAAEPLPLHLAVRDARERLCGDGIEAEIPGVTWLPVICQHPAEVPPTWQDLGGIYPQPAAETIPLCPYQGLSAFREKDARFFFGREALAEQLRVAAKQKPLVAVIGPSGIGKSSAVFAGLVPRLREDSGGDAKGDAGMQIVDFRPGPSPFDALAGALAPLLPSGQKTEIQYLRENLRQKQTALQRLIEIIVRNQGRGNPPAVAPAQQLSESRGNPPAIAPAQQFNESRGGAPVPAPAEGRGNALPPPAGRGNHGGIAPTELSNSVDANAADNPKSNSSLSRLVLIADQFEELYTLCQDGSERQQFLDCLLAALSAPAFTLVLTLRADFFSQALDYRPFRDALQLYNSELIGPMNPQELREAIEKPAALLDIQLEEGLSDRILDEVSDMRGQLPLVQFALTQLWARQNNRLLTHRAYEQIGGVEESLAEYAELAYAQLSEADRQRARAIFIQLVHPGEGTEDTRRLANRAEVGEENWDLVTRLASARLVVTGSLGDKGTGGQPVFVGATASQGQSRAIADNFVSGCFAPGYATETVEIVHEALIRGWGRLGQWMRVDRAFRSWQERLRSAMRLWQSNEKREGYLLRGAPLAEAEAWLQKREDISPGEREYIRASLELRDKEKAERDRQELEKLEAQVALETAEQSNQILKNANRRANLRLRIGSAVLGVSIIAAAIIGGLAANRVKKAIVAVDTARQEVKDLQQKMQTSNQAVNNFDKVVSLMAPVIDSTDDVSLLNYLGSAYYVMGKHSTAIDYYKRGLNMAIAQNNCDSVSISWLYLVNAYKRMAIPTEEINNIHLKLRENSSQCNISWPSRQVNYSVRLPSQGTPEKRAVTGTR